MRKSLFAVLLTALAFMTVPAFATTTCTSQYLMYHVWYQCANNPQMSNFYTNTGWVCATSGGYYGADGSTSAATLSFPATTQSGDALNAYFSISFAVDMVNSHNNAQNLIYVTVHNDSYSIYELIGTIDGSGGDLCTRNYAWNNLYRPGWVGQSLSLNLEAHFSNIDALVRINGPSFIQDGFDTN